ncbi:MAG: Holliday junction branch migration protein RuvA [Thiomicrospira sp.]|jgi:Holliday junction DNA helicase RuvA|nr:Holliday junction branch migration protein RuvA [Thiomicrospira sp.]
MIGFLRGNLAFKQPPLLVVDVQGVGYELEAPMSSFYALGEVGTQVTLLTHMHVREDAMSLFGFVSEAERTLFRELIKVSGIGAKMALAILSSLSVEEFCVNVQAADALALTRVPGIGKKTAERLLLEVRDRLAKHPILTGQYSLAPTTESAGLPNQVSALASDALVSLGYKEAQAQALVKAAYEDGMSLETLIKRALQQVKL